MLTEGMYVADRYEIVGKVGTGGMSDVYKAKDHILGRFVAIKVLKAEFSEDRNFVTKFRTEAQSAAGLEHPNIVNIYDVGSENGFHYIVMEYIEGITLKTYIEKKHQLNYKEALSIAIQVARGIESAHNKNIIHRDIKPQNIIISTEGKVKVTDFGIAKAISSNTVSSDVMGSVHYTSPEHARNGAVDGRSDIYSLGIVMYEMVTGRVPFDGDTTVAVAIQHLQEEMVQPSAYAPNLPISMEKIILKCTQKNPDRRYQTIAELLADLRRCLTTPDADFVSLPTPEGGATKVITQEELHEIKDMTPEPAYEEIAPRRQPQPVPTANSYDFDDDEDDDGELNPKMSKAFTIMFIVIAVLIVALIIYIVASMLGAVKFGKSTDTETQNVTESQSAQVEVPDLYGMSLDEATSALSELGLSITVTGYSESDELSDNCVLSQDVEQGTMVASGSAVGVTLVGSTEDADDLVAVPSVIGYTEAEAIARLQDNNLSYERTYETSDTVEAGIVISQTPTEGSSVSSGYKVQIVISQGKASVSVPKVAGYSEEDAQAALEALGLVVEIAEESSDSVEAGYVIKQDIAAGKTVSSGTTITITVSTGSEAAASYKASVSGIDLGVDNPTNIKWELQDDSGTVYDSGSMDASTTSITSKELENKNATKFVITFSYTDASGATQSGSKSYSASYN